MQVQPFGRAQVQRWDDSELCAGSVLASDLAKRLVSPYVQAAPAGRVPNDVLEFASAKFGAALELSAPPSPADRKNAVGRRASMSPLSNSVIQNRCAFRLLTV